MPTPRREPPVESHGKPLKVTVYIAELVCMMCGASDGTIESPAWPMRCGEAVWHRPDANVLRVVGPQQLRCERCGGNLMMEHVECAVRNVERIQELDAAPRMGRPPKWLVEARRLAELTAAG